MTTTTLTQTAYGRADRADRVQDTLSDQWPGTEFRVVDHGLPGLMVTWTDGPTRAQVRRLLAPETGPVQLCRQPGTEGTAMALQVMQSLAPWTSLTRFGRPARNRALYLQDSLTYRDVFALERTPTTVGDVMDALFDRLTLP